MHWRLALPSLAERSSNRQSSCGAITPHPVLSSQAPDTLGRAHGRQTRPRPLSAPSNGPCRARPESPARAAQASERNAVFCRAASGKPCWTAPKKGANVSETAQMWATAESREAGKPHHGGPFLAGVTPGASKVPAPGNLPRLHIAGHSRAGRARTGNESRSYL